MPEPVQAKAAESLAQQVSRYLTQDSKSSNGYYAGFSLKPLSDKGEVRLKVEGSDQSYSLWLQKDARGEFTKLTALTPDQVNKMYEQEVQPVKNSLIAGRDPRTGKEFETKNGPYEWFEKRSGKPADPAKFDEFKKILVEYDDTEKKFKILSEIKDDVGVNATNASSVFMVDNTFNVGDKILPTDNKARGFEYSQPVIPNDSSLYAMQKQAYAITQVLNQTRNNKPASELVVSQVELQKVLSGKSLTTEMSFRPAVVIEEPKKAEINPVQDSRPVREPNFPKPQAPPPAASKTAPVSAPPGVTNDILKTLMPSVTEIKTKADLENVNNAATNALTYFVNTGLPNANPTEKLSEAQIGKVLGSFADLKPDNFDTDKKVAQLLAATQVAIIEAGGNRNKISAAYNQAVNALSGDSPPGIYRKKLADLEYAPKEKPSTPSFTKQQLADFYDAFGAAPDEKNLVVRLPGEKDVRSIWITKGKGGGADYVALTQADVQNLITQIATNGEKNGLNKSMGLTQTFSVVSGTAITKLITNPTPDYDLGDSKIKVPPLVEAAFKRLDGSNASEIAAEKIESAIPGFKNQSGANPFKP